MTTAEQPNDEESLPSSPTHGPYPTPRSLQGSPGPLPVGSLPTRFGSGRSLAAASSSSSVASSFWVGPTGRIMRRRVGKGWHVRPVTLGVGLLVGFFFLMNWWMLFRIQDSGPGRGRVLKYRLLSANSSHVHIPVLAFEFYVRINEERAEDGAGRIGKAGQREKATKNYICEAVGKGCSCAGREGNNGYMMVSANGGINQQRVAVCNAVAVARLLNATLVLPKFMYSSVWRDVSQFGDIYQEEHFINYLKPDIRIVKELPEELQSLDLEAIGSVVTDADVVKEAKPSFYLKHILPILHLNRVVHFVGFGNRLASDPIPYHLQFVPKVQEIGALLIRRIRQNATQFGTLDRHLVGPFAESKLKGKRYHAHKASTRYLALHLRFEIDMVAHSLCDFGGGEEERRELEAYREVHFPALMELKKTKKLPSPAALKSEGLCPLMPEETVLMLAALGFNRRTRIFLAGAHIYGGKSRMAALTTLFPNLVTKENLLSSSEIQPFMNFSSQLAALDFIGCTAADAFAMTDSGSQLSSLVSGFRVYYGGGKMPTIRPNKRRLADIFMKNNTIEWKVFETRVRKAIRQTKRVFSRPTGRSVYRYPRCDECMCNTDLSA
ncbi:hypothetical protein RJ639_046135 [Escallonia herrerae]|uniref:O-fucosyltransferase family protein n=1 Tax=Escallonia herrerae TaxID=1293975 RepID=A0AA88W6G4_9ASTE|nr:hypothetical protein RJ639_046135 [Escallonia herrerae]